MEIENGFDKDQIINDLRSKLLAMDEKTSESPLQPPSLEPPLSLPPAPIQPPTDQRTSTDKSLNQIKQFFRDRSPEISEPMIIPTDSESDDADEKSDVQFAPNQSTLSNNQIYKRKKKAKKTEATKVRFLHDVLVKY